MQTFPGLAALALIVGTIAAALGGLFAASGGGDLQIPWAYIGRILRFTTMQAALSTAMSLALGAAIALALARRARFSGRTAFVAALNLASVLPPIVAVFAIVAVLGRSGWVAPILDLFGVRSSRWLYGMPGILVAHVFFNAPLAARIFLGSLDTVPGEHWRLAAQLGMRPGAIFRLIDRPVLARDAPGVAALVFLLCFTSFAIVLALGGGPNSASLEVAIYEAVRFEADFARAAILALIQILLGLGLAAPILFLSQTMGETAALGGIAERPDAASRATLAFDLLALSVAALLVLPPLAALVASGIAALPSLAAPIVGKAFATSLAIAAPAGALAVIAALALARLAASWTSGGHPRAAAAAIGLASTLALVVPPVALSAGLFVLLRRSVDPFTVAAPMIVAVNALMSLPFAYRQVAAPVAVAHERYGRLATSLGMGGAARLRLVDWPLVRRPVLVAFAVSAALSFGDLGVAAFFGTGNLVTLPLLLSERMGAYRMDEAASLALLLAVLVLGLFLVAQKGSGGLLARGR